MTSAPGAAATPRLPKTLLSVEETADLLGTNRSTLYRSIGRGDFPLPLYESTAASAFRLPLCND